MKLDHEKLIYVDSLIKTIDKNFNNYSIIFKFDDIVYSVLEILLCKDINEFKEFKKTQVFFNKITNDGFTIESFQDLSKILELNNYYKSLFDGSRKEIKSELIEVLKTYSDSLIFLLIDFDFEEIQVNEINSIKTDIAQFKSSITREVKQDVRETETNDADDVEWLIIKLKEMYNSAPQGYQMSFVHLFGIRYAEQLKKQPIKRIAFEATGKESLYVEIGKGIKLSKYVYELENVSEAVERVLDVEFEYKVSFSDKDTQILNQNNTIINNNYRSYVHYGSNRKHRVKSSGIPTYFECKDFKWEGSSWKTLMSDFADWFLTKTKFNYEEIVKLRTQFSNQEVFSYINKTNFLGPFKNQLFINGNHTSLHMWWQMLELLNTLDKEYAKDAYVIVRYPSAVEPKENIQIFWYHEIKLFQIYLKKENINNPKKYLDGIKVFNTIYRKRYPNHYLFLIDNKQDMVIAVSRLRKFEFFQKNEKIYSEVLSTMLDFKKKLIYPDFDFRKN